MSAEVQLAVVGAGVAGLAAARDLRRDGLDVAVFEAGERPGGVMRTGEARGFLFERGPNAFRVSAPARAFLERHGLVEALRPAAAETRLRKLFLDGRLVPVPSGVVGALRTPLLSPSGKLRLLREPFVARGAGAGESVAEFVARRFGDEALERVVAPALVGVYAGDERQLGAEAVFPSLVGFEREHGSVLAGALRAALRRGAGAPERGLPGSWSAQGGLAAFAALLADGLGPSLHTGARVTAVAREEGAWRVEASGAPPLRARALLLATEAPAAAALLAELDAELAALLTAIEYAPLATLALDVDPRDAREPIEGFGFLVPRQAGIELLGALFMSRAFPGRAPAGRELVTAMIGGRRWPGAAEADDAALLERTGRGLERVLGLRMLSSLAISRWPRAVPQPCVEHVARVRALRERVSKLPGLALAGGYLDGVGVSDALVSGARAAAELAPAAC